MISACDIRIGKLHNQKADGTADVALFRLDASDHRGPVEGDLTQFP